ncbi:hypothetical protein [Chachezhania antarctica]|uniref:hypothetical protein n=1 Tax=Chachezhania antarctica TaxID=2340860 RepID=UPI000EAE4D4B|nr:hypothetical protein [Chachezhania antarctica]|tara:strand:+ start:575 stop:853 length:279 start_codon:yes stop_codon:yes gene_type:complete
MIAKFKKSAIAVTALSAAVVISACDTTAGTVSPTEAMSFCLDTTNVEGISPTIMPGAVEPITFDDFDLGPEDMITTAQKDNLLHCYNEKMAQ